MFSTIYNLFSNCCKKFAIEHTDKGKKISSQKKTVTGAELERIFAEQSEIAILDLSLESVPNFSSGYNLNPTYILETYVNDMVSGLTTVLKSSAANSLREISLQGCNLSISPTSVEKIIGAIKSNPRLHQNLQKLDLSCNGIDDYVTVNSLLRLNPQLDVKIEGGRVPGVICR